MFQFPVFVLGGAVSRAQEKLSRTGVHARIAGCSLKPRIYERGPHVLI